MNDQFDALVAELVTAGAERDMARAVGAAVALQRLVAAEIERVQAETSPRPVAVLERPDEQPPASPTRTRRTDGTGERRTFPTGQ